MTEFLKADWLKLQRRWMPRLLLVIEVVILGFVFFGVGGTTDGKNLAIPTGTVFALLLSATFAQFLWPVLAGSWSGSEYGWGTVRTMLSRRPGRIEFVISGLLIVLLVVAAAIILATVAGSVGGIIVAALTNRSVLNTAGVDNAWLEVAKMVLSTWYTSAFWAILAYSLAIIFRSQATGIGVGIGFSIASGIINGIFSRLGGAWQQIAQHLPNAYTGGLVDHIANETLRGRIIGSTGNEPDVIPSLIGITIYAALLIGVALAVTLERDVSA